MLLNPLVREVQSESSLVEIILDILSKQIYDAEVELERNVLEGSLQEVLTRFGFQALIKFPKLLNVWFYKLSFQH
jgi:hypothetical protein